MRWFQFATFSPLQRVYGYQSNVELWRYGKEVESITMKYLNLCYRLMPYIYSQVVDIEFNNDTVMRPLVMDFVEDEKALEQKYEYMFGSSFLVAPVVEKAVQEWEVYLPKFDAGWYNFWTGQHYSGGKMVKTEASLTTIPLYVKSGSIIPIGNSVQSISEIPSDTLEIRIYSGTDGTFELYEDEGTNYNYENGNYSFIPFEWDEQKQILTIDKRKGSYNGMSKNRVFKVVWVNEANGVGIEPDKKCTLVQYSGNKIKLLR